MKKFLIAFLLLTLSFPANAAEKETAYERIIRTNTLKCGYIISGKMVEKDPNTGALSGVMVDIINEAARLLNLKVDWSTELGWGSGAQDLKQGKVDALCTNYWINPAESREIGFSIPLFYSAVGAYVRAGDHRFDKNLDAVNDPSIKIIGSDGDMSMLIAHEDFPKASLSSLPNLTETSQFMTELASGKGDITFIDVVLGDAYMKKNPGKVVNIAAKNPVRVFANTMAIPNNDPALKNMIDAALMQVLQNGYVDRTLKKYDKLPGTIYRVAKPYETFP